MAINAAFLMSDELIERTITLADGTEHQFLFREVSNPDYNAFLVDRQSSDADLRAKAVARLIACSVCEPDGTPAMSIEVAARLKPRITNAFVGVILEINFLGAEQKKASPPEEKSGSGTPSHSLSAAEALPNGSDA